MAAKKCLLIMILLPRLMMAEKILRSTLQSGTVGQIIGAKYDIQNSSRIIQASSNMTGLGICMRIRFRAILEDSRIITIARWRYHPLDNYDQMMWMRIVNPYGFFGFGFPFAKDSYNNWIIKWANDSRMRSDLDRSIWRPNHWTSWCFSFNPTNHFVALIIDGKKTNIFHHDKKLRKVRLPEDFLDLIYLGMCNWDKGMTCAGDSTSVANFNIWNR